MAALFAVIFSTLWNWWVSLFATCRRDPKCANTLETAATGMPGIVAHVVSIAVVEGFLSNEAAPLGTSGDTKNMFTSSLEVCEGFRDGTDLIPEVKREEKILPASEISTFKQT